MEWESLLRRRSTHSGSLFLYVTFLLIPVTLPSQTTTSGNASIQEIPAQSVPQTQPDDKKQDDKNKQDNKSQKEPPERQTNRIMGVVPNFGAVSANTQLPPLNPHQKFVLAYHDSFDYSSFIWTGIIAFQSFGLNSDPELGRGFAGYSRYYWRAFVDGVSGTYFTEAIIPVITHEDPRYYTLGHGGFFRRSGYALSRTFLTRTDSGGRTFNWSEVGGNACEAALSNLYYPPQERGVSQTFRGWGNQMESAALNNVVKEFWPDIRHKVLRRK